MSLRIQDLEDLFEVCYFGGEKFCKVDLKRCWKLQWYMERQSFFIEGVVDYVLVDDFYIYYIQVILIRCNGIFLKERERKWI